MRGREKGAALVWALLLLTLAGALSSLLLARGRSVDVATKEDAASLVSFYAAEGGVALARRRLAANPGYAGETVRVGACEVTVVVQRREGGWVVRTCSSATAIQATLREGPGLPTLETHVQVNR